MPRHTKTCSIGTCSEHVVVPFALAKWRHWKPGKLEDETPVTQQPLETELRRRWAERLLSHLAPYADHIPYMQSIDGDNKMEEYIDLLGDTRFRTPRVRCLALENLRTEKDVRDLLNHLRTQDATQVAGHLGHFEVVFFHLRPPGGGLPGTAPSQAGNHSGISGGDIQQASEQG